ncbi:FAD-dependent oxidoreductase [Bradyrhizobium sp. NP1]|uniref:NAD(P)/FAD-dependent oxidoreductase n=1 Tax=Bradyrhizobium sp. NP1 TaxID=3049772 RepID=UPI0025A68191|nr:FAD-dependent oxidoreductase [Bradyrhizobium sp. NP1]WJR81886.1 FAD-dependent oxidoreductase [Bradyrhizobium sp. NP1]
MRPTGRLPDHEFKSQPLWWDDDPPFPAGEGPLPHRCDVVVVGGGFAGLSTARELARSGSRVVVLEADSFGFNASARNSGGISFGLDLNKAASWHHWSGGKAPPVPELARGAAESVSYMEKFIAENAIDCDYHRRGRLSCAPSPRHYEILSRRLDALNRLFDADAHMVPRSEQRSEIGSDRFFGAMVVKRSGQLNPAKLLKALVALCRSSGAQLFSDTLVTGIERRAGGFMLTTARGAIQADSVVVAVNAQAARLSAAGLASRIVPVASHIIVTEPLPEEVANALLPNRRTGADGRRLLAYFRRTPDGNRFLYGSRASPFDVSPEQAAAVLYRRMVASFPQLDGFRIRHAWGCKVGFTFDGLPHLGESDGLYYVMGCNGNGVAMMNYLGYQLARKMIERSGPTCVFDQPIFPGLPLYRGNAWFLPLVSTAYGLLDRSDALRARLSQG